MHLITETHPLHGIIWIDRERVSGEPCFHHTRVPLKNLFDTLASGDSLDQFLDDYEGVTREQAVAVLGFAFDRLMESLPKP